MTFIRFYTTAGCHLCEQAEGLLNHVSTRHSIQVQPIEIGDDDALVAEFGLHIPVLTFANDQRLYWPFTEADIEQQLDPG